MEFPRQEYWSGLLFPSPSIFKIGLITEKLVYKPLFRVMTSLVAQTVKHLPTMQETRLQSLGQEDLLEKEMATHSSTLAWKIPWTEEPGRLQSMGSQRVGHDWATSLSLSFQSYDRLGAPLDKGLGAWIVVLPLLFCRCRSLGKSLNLVEPHFSRTVRGLITYSLRSYLKSSSILLYHLFCTVASA